jgi:glyoxylase-like metal-dependent hydrolase (beta-lactamase superfamily II)/8-oxo-dGTP pyrophosphatase MutT (NUDIX family)
VEVAGEPPRREPEARLVRPRTTAQGELRSFRMAAAVLLTRGGSDELELYLVQRSPRLAVFPGWWALPGGNVDACDGDAYGISLEPFLRAAVRELFEECGVLAPGLAPLLPPHAHERRAALRRDLTCRERDASPTVSAEWNSLYERLHEPFVALDPFCWATTPAFAAMRHRALYVQLELPDGEVPTIEPGELVDGRWWKPAELWSTWQRGELWIVPPLVFLLEQLGAGCTLAEAKRRARERSAAVDAGRLHVVQPAPGLRVAPLPTPTLPPATTTNCALVGWDPAYVVDPATYVEGERARLLAWIDAERANGLRVAGVIATHHHRDHVGSIAHVARHCEVPVLAHARTLARLPEASARSRVLADGDRIELGVAPDGTPDWHLVALHTPGHDAGHLVFRDSRYRWIVGGDLVSTLSTIVIEPPDGHLATYIASLQRVLDEGCGAILPAHGGIAADGEKLLAKYLKHRALREAMLVSALKRIGEASLDALLGEVYSDTPKELHGLARCSLLAGLQKLAEEQRARESSVGRWIAT